MLDLEAVRKEYDRLDKILGINTTGILLQYGENPKTDIVAYTQFSRQNGRPIRIKFNLSHMRGKNDQDWMDTVRHEYAHAAARILYGYQGAHGEPWQTVCKKIGCRPSPYTYDASVIEDIASYDMPGEPLVAVQCAGCGMIVKQPERSRIVKVLRNGGSSWNLRCKNCGRMIFRIAELR